MRILQVIRTLNPAWGGPVEGARHIAIQAIRRGHDPHILCLDAPGSPWLQEWRAEVHAIGCVGPKYGFTTTLDRWLEKNLSQFALAIVHSIWMYFSYSVWKAAGKAGVPYYLFIHGALDPWFKQRYPLKHLKKTIYWKLAEHKVVRDAAAVLFTSDEEMRLANNAFLPWESKSVVVGYGMTPPPEKDPCDRNRLSADFSTSFPALRNRPYLLCLSRIHEKKGIDLLLRAYAQTRNLLDGAAVVIAGPGNEKYISSLRALAVSLGIGEDVLWVGPLYGESKLNALRAADVYCLPSHQENFGLSVAESLACSTPVLISDKVNIWREVQGAGAGFAEPDDLNGTIRGLQRWAGLPPAERREMRERAKSCFAANFDMSVVSDRLFNTLSAAQGFVSSQSTKTSGKGQPFKGSGLWPNQVIDVSLGEGL